jgi:hypothetical protein
MPVVFVFVWSLVLGSKATSTRNFIKKLKAQKRNMPYSINGPALIALLRQFIGALLWTSHAANMRNSLAISLGVNFIRGDGPATEPTHDRTLQCAPPYMYIQPRIHLLVKFDA